MQSSNMPPQTSAELSRSATVQPAPAETKGQTLLGKALVLQPLVAATAVTIEPSTTISQAPNNQTNAAGYSAAQSQSNITLPAPDSSLFRTTFQQTLQVSPQVRLTPAEQLLLVSLPVNSTLNTIKDAPAFIQSLLPANTAATALPALLKLTPNTLKLQISQTEFQTLISVLSKSMPPVMEIPAKVLTQGSSQVRVNVGVQKPLIIDIPLQAKGTAASATTPDITTNSHQKLPQPVSFIILPGQAHWQIQISPQSAAPPTPANSSTNPLTNVPERRTIKDSVVATLPADSAILGKLSMAVLQHRAINIKPPQLFAWAQQTQPATVIRQLSQLCPALPLALSLKGSELIIAGTRVQLQGITTAPEASLANQSPKLTTSVANQLNIQLPGSLKLPLATIQHWPGTEISQTDKPSVGQTSLPVTSTAKQFSDSTLASVTTRQEQNPTENRFASLAKIRLEQLPVEVKVALEQFIRSADRLNRVNTDPQLPNVASLINTIQKFAAATPSLAKPLNMILEQLQVGLQPAFNSGSDDSAQTKPESLGSASQPNTKPGLDSSQLSSAIRQLMTSSAWLQTAGTLTSPPTGQNFLNGLIQLLQLSLLGRHFKSQDDIEQALSRHRSNGTTGSSSAGILGTVTGRQVREFAQLDNQQNLLKQIKGLLAGHQGAKLSNMDQAMQGQDSFYYALPGLLPDQRTAEIVIRREQERTSEKQKEKTRGQWNLTMKLDIGAQGELLTKARIVDHQLYLDIYSSNQSLLEKVGVTLPFLLKRFKQLGLSVEEHKLQLGKIPDTLASRPYHILETQA